MPAKPSSVARLVLAAFAILAVAAALSFAMWNADHYPKPIAKGLAVVFFLFSAPFLVLIHELGHLSMALAFGWRVPILTLGGLSLRFSPLRFSAGAPAFPRASGAVLAVPPEKGGERFAWIAVSFGGPGANFLLAALAAWAGFAAAKDSTAYGMFLGVAGVSLVAGLFNLVPQGGSDGMHILADLFARDFAARGRLLRLLAQMVDGKRPRDWDTALVRSVEADSIWRGDAHGPLYVYAWHLDRGEIPQARAVLRRIADHADEPVHIEQAFLFAWLDNQPAAARRFLSQATSWQSRRLPAYWRALTAVTLAEGDGAAAREALRKWRTECKDWAYTTQDEWDWLATLESSVAAIAA
ncbi:MAG TPA: site-2 protease family protein [Rhizomicrobium sp.]|jgi:Zn-dependent protease